MMFEALIGMGIVIGLLALTYGVRLLIDRFWPTRRDPEQ